MKQSQNRLGKYGDDGYSLEKSPDDTIVVWFKETMVAALTEVVATPEAIQDICKRHQARMKELAEVRQWSIAIPVSTGAISIGGKATVTSTHGNETNTVRMPMLATARTTRTGAPNIKWHPQRSDK